MRCGEVGARGEVGGFLQARLRRAAVHLGEELRGAGRHSPFRPPRASPGSSPEGAFDPGRRDGLFRSTRSAPTAPCCLTGSPSARVRRRTLRVRNPRLRRAASSPSNGDFQPGSSGNEGLRREHGLRSLLVRSSPERKCRTRISVCSPKARIPDPKGPLSNASGSEPVRQQGAVGALRVDRKKPSRRPGSNALSGDEPGEARGGRNGECPPAEWSSSPRWTAARRSRA